jgi:membrane fusion protein (multidrug efflux system)
MNLKTVLLGATALGFVLALASCHKAEAAQAPVTDQAIRVGTVVVRPTVFAETGVYYGKLAANRSVTLVAVLGGRVDSIDVAEGTRVGAGQSLGKINAEKAQATRDLAQLNERVAKDNFARQKQFLGDGNASQIQVDQAEVAWLAAKNSLIDAQKALDGALCSTPIPGVVTRRFIDAYQELAPGSPTFSVSDVDRMRVGFGIPEPEVAGVAVGNSADVTVAGSAAVWHGTVTRLSREVSSQTLSFDAEVTIDNPDRSLLPGGSATVTLQRRKLEGQIVVPSEAVLSAGQDTFVMVEQGGTAHRAIVVPGPSSRTKTVILKGLAAGQNVIVQGNNLTAEGSPVQVTVRE